MSSSASCDINQIKQQHDVKKALKQTSTVKTAEPVVVETKNKLWLATYAVLLLALGGIYYLLRLEVIFPAKLQALSLRLTLGFLAITMIMGIAKSTNVFLIETMDEAVTRYNLKHIMRLVESLFIAFIVISILFANWYTAVVSLGLISLIG